MRGWCCGPICMLREGFSFRGVSAYCSDRFGSFSVIIFLVSCCLLSLDAYAQCLGFSKEMASHSIISFSLSSICFLVISPFLELCRRFIS